jgi:2-(1,2-epoxy-1,2-dihydrophenyl)acetyl-CoA isomerase
MTGSPSDPNLKVDTSRDPQADAPIQVHRDAGVVTIVLNRPTRRNALRTVDYAQLADVFRDIRHTVSDRVVVLTGAGDHFCAGSDLAGLDPHLGAAETMTVMRQIQATVIALYDVGKPVIAAVAGYAVGAGCNLALGADIIYASESAKLGQIFIKRGLALDFGGSYLLPRRVGPGKAKLLAFTGAIVEAAEAERIGLVDFVCGPHLLRDNTERSARDLATHPPLALSGIKRQIDRGAASTFEEAIEYEILTQSLCTTSGEMAAAMARNPRS